MKDFSYTWGKPSKWNWKYCISFCAIRNSRIRLVKGNNGFIQVWKFAFIWNL